MDKYTIKITKEYTDVDMENIVVTALEGGIGYWACLDNDCDDFNEKPDGTPTSVWCWQLLKKGKELRFLDAGYPDEAEYRLDLQTLLYGIEKAIECNVWDGDMDIVDAEVADAIFQYSIFDDIIYG